MGRIERVCLNTGSDQKGQAKTVYLNIGSDRKGLPVGPKGGGAKGVYLNIGSARNGLPRERIDPGASRQRTRMRVEMEWGGGARSVLRRSDGKFELGVGGDEGGHRRGGVGDVEWGESRMGLD